MGNSIPGETLVVLSVIPPSQKLLVIFPQSTHGNAKGEPGGGTHNTSSSSTRDHGMVEIQASLCVRKRVAQVFEMNGYANIRDHNLHLAKMDRDIDHIARTVSGMARHIRLMVRTYVHFCTFDSHAYIKNADAMFSKLM